LPVLFDRLRTRVAAIPGVQAVAVAETGPLASRRFTTDVRVGGREPVHASRDGVTPGFFDAVGLRVVAGRDFRRGDSPSAARVAIINTTLARRLFDSANPIGRTVDVPVPGAGFRAHEVIGVASDAQYHDLHVPPAPTIWFPDDAPYMPTLHVRTTDANTGKMVAAIMREFDAIDDQFPVFDVKSLDGRIADALARERMAAGRVIAQEFLGVAAADAAALGISIAVMGLIAGVAVSIPAFRASRVDPLTALRAD
jgi:hypothetical protein